MAAKGLLNLENIFVGALLATEERPLGFSLHQKQKLNPKDVQDQFLSQVFQATLVASNQWNVPPSPANIADIMLGTGMIVPTSDESVPDVKAKLVENLIKLAVAGAANPKGFTVAEAMLTDEKRNRQLIEYHKTVGDILANPVGTAASKGDELRTQLEDITQHYSPDATVLTEEDQIKAIQDNVAERRSMLGKRLMTLPPAMGNLLNRKLLPYFRKGLLYMVMGGTGTGKSSFMEQCSDWLSRGYKVAYFGLEDAYARKAYRQACRHIPGAVFDFLERGDQDDKLAELVALRRTWRGEGGSFTYVHCPGKSVNWITNEINKIDQAVGGLDVVFVDYLQKIKLRETSSGENETTVWTEVCELLKQRAEDPERPLVMVCGSQVTVDQNGMPHAKNVKAAEDKAQVVLIIERAIATDDEAFGGVVLAKKGQRSVKTTLHLSKNNDGETGRARLLNWGPSFMFMDSTYLQWTTQHPNEPETMPVMTAPTEAEKRIAAEIDTAYRRAAEIRNIPA